MTATGFLGRYFVAPKSGQRAPDASPGLADKALSETDFSQSLKRCDISMLLNHGEDGQVVPVVNSMRSARVIENAKDSGAPEGKERS